MSQFRQDFITKEWVIIAPERAKRPDQFRQETNRQAKLPDRDPDCPFCPGNEYKDPPPVLTEEKNGQWKVRVVPNKFAAVRSDVALDRKTIGDQFVAEGFGIAEVVVEHPRHNVSLATISEDEVKDVLTVYRSRYTSLAQTKDINLITIFRNHGARAGTSLEHPHSQIIATPIVPPHVRQPMHHALLYHDSFGRCPYCVLLEEELTDKERLIMENENFVCFAPFASHSPFETRIMPKRHASRFDSITDEELNDLAAMLHLTLNKLYVGLNNPDYNLLIRSSPTSDGDLNYDHWRIIIVPRISTAAGFELGSGIFINIMKPEEAARFLRELKIK